MMDVPAKDDSRFKDGRVRQRADDLVVVLMSGQVALKAWCRCRWRASSLKAQGRSSGLGLPGRVVGGRQRHADATRR